MKRIILLIFLLFIFSFSALAQTQKFDGVETGLHNLFRISDAETRSISPENFTGEKGKAGMATEGTGKMAARNLGQGWKISPSVRIAAHTTFTMAEITGSGAVQHIWMTPTGNWRYSIFRIYWDDETEPSIEVPVGDFFGQGWGEYAPLASLPMAVNPGSAFNSYWVMPFRKKCKITMENIDERDMVLYYQVDYTVTKVPDDAAYFHAQFHRTNPLKYKDVYTLVDGIKGQGQYVGTYIAWGVHNRGWWGEGEIKFYMDGDKDFPTIAGTGTEDYFCGSYNFENRKTHEYQVFNSPYSGLMQVIKPDGVYVSQQRFGLYRWHIADPIRFKKDLRVTIQALGWKTTSQPGEYLPLQDDISSVVYWYQTEPHAKFPTLPKREELEIN
ncbi:MAG: DUF2961 domain-containing protein [Acidobacteria bacterium]|nr:DUF2961 domain-containing protein [Acidobacteriota bacterium]